MPKPFLKPDLAQYPERRPILYITGTLPSALIEDAYEGRLQIHNAKGFCSVEQIAGDKLPNGSQIYVDQDLDQIVIAWPKYSENAAPIVNPGFETGDISGWTITKTGGTAGVASASPTRPYVGQYSAFWQGERGLGHAGGIEALWLNDNKVEAFPGRTVTASAQIALDDTHVSQNRGEVRLRFYDKDDQLIREFAGNLIRGNNSNYRLSSVTVPSPAGTAFAQVGVWTTANYSGGVRFDQVQWDLPAIVGTRESATLNLTLRVTDDAGRTALWSGTLDIIPIPEFLGWEQVYNPGVCVAVCYDESIQQFVMVQGGSTSVWESPTGDDGTWVEYPNMLPTTPKSAVGAEIWLGYNPVTQKCFTTFENTDGQIRGYIFSHGSPAPANTTSLYHTGIGIAGQYCLVTQVHVYYSITGTSWSTRTSVGVNYPSMGAYIPSTGQWRTFVYSSDSTPMSSRLYTDTGAFTVTTSAEEGFPSWALIGPYNRANYAPSIGLGMLCNSTSSAPNLPFSVWTYTGPNDAPIMAGTLPGGFNNMGRPVYVPWAGKWILAADLGQSATPTTYVGDADGSAWIAQTNQYVLPTFSVNSVTTTNVPDVSIAESKRILLTHGYGRIFKARFRGISS